jgi:hypothetical protein
VNPASRRRLALAALALLGLACAGARPRPAPAPAGTAAPADPGDALAGKNDEELLAIGLAAAQAGDDARAAAAFARLAAAFPGSPHRPAALHDAGLAYRRLERFEDALAHFAPLADGYTGDDADEAAFLAAEALFRLGRRAEAKARLAALERRPDVPPALRARALTERGVVELEEGAPDAAEATLGAALAALGDASARERLAPAETAKARFWLAEVRRARFLGVKLEPRGGDEAELADRLERKAALLLSAQEEYLGAMRVGDPGFTVAAGARVGELYDALYTELVGAPVPPGLDAEGEAAYRAELRGRVRVLVGKAVTAYEETLAAARRAGVENAFVPRAREALQRMQAVLAEDDGTTR